MRLSHMTFPAPRPCLHLIKKKKTVNEAGSRCKNGAPLQRFVSPHPKRQILRGARDLYES